MYTGQAKLKLYEDSSCTKEITLSHNGDYILNSKIITGHSNGEYRKNVYVKNVGTHKAYNIYVNIISDWSNSVTISKNFNVLPSNSKEVFTITTPYVKGDKKTIRVSIKLDYDNVP